ncbi:glycoside hydrolase family 113 [Amycolatopsis suaedae]|nr:hypothetical protein [Amycolatopsis suaedae]
MVEEVPLDAVRRDLRVIREELHCNAVILIGMDIQRLMESAEYALEVGLDVWIEPHPSDIPYVKVVSNLAVTAAAAERLRARYPGRVFFILGCEFSLHLHGMIPGRPETVRILFTMKWRHRFRRRINRKVNDLLSDALATVRSVFNGPVTYASAAWEEVDWSGFDYVGVNLYRTASNAHRFTDHLRELQETSGKPLVITEFGCGSFVGAPKKGPGSFKIVNWFSLPPRIRKGHIRSERIQAAYIAHLIDVYDSQGVHGCFVFTFSLKDYPHHQDPRFDLDMAAFGVVKVSAEDPTRWERKEAFHELARQYSELAGRS